MRGSEQTGPIPGEYSFRDMVWTVRKPAGQDEEGDTINILLSRTSLLSQHRFLIIPTAPCYSVAARDNQKLGRYDREKEVCVSIAIVTY